MTDITLIRAAADRLAGHARRTSLLSSPFLDDIAGKRVLFKPECLQLTGSFKFRGAWAAISAMTDDERKRGVISYSSGNHAQGVALAAQMHDCPAVIIMPQNAPQIKLDYTRAYGAEVITYDRAGGESREDIGEKIQAQRNLTFVRPYDEIQVVAGQGTVGLEIAAQAAEMGIEQADVFVCCGGGGLTSGIALALEAEAPGMTVRPVEPDGFDDVARSLASGQIEHNTALSGSLCDAILTPAPGQITFPIMQRLCGPGLTVTDDQCLDAMAQAFLRLKLVVEPGGAAAMAAALYHADQSDADTIIATISGGNVDPAVFQTALQRV